jgi:hypothetical protein
VKAEKALVIYTIDNKSQDVWGDPNAEHDPLENKDDVI